MPAPPSSPTTLLDAVTEAGLPPGRLDATESVSLLQALAAVPDPRKARGRRHALRSVLLLAVGAVLAGARSYAAIAQWAGCAAARADRLGPDPPREPSTAASASAHPPPKSGPYWWISSPYDPDARWAAKGEDLFWTGYKVHLTETCDRPADGSGDDHPDDGAFGATGPDDDRHRPNLIVSGATTDASVTDAKMTEPIHAALAERDPHARRTPGRSGLPVRGPGHRQRAPLGASPWSQPAAGRPITSGPAL